MADELTRERAKIARQLQRSVGALTTSTVTRMERDMAWFRDLSAEDRSWIGLIVQSGIKAFVTWFEEPVVDSVLRAEADENVLSRASALGWESSGDVVVVLGRVPHTQAVGPD